MKPICITLSAVLIVTVAGTLYPSNAAGSVLDFTLDGYITYALDHNPAIIAAKAVAFKQAMTPEFADYQRQIVKNAKVLAETLVAHGLELISGGTDNHIVLINLTKNNLTGIDAENALGQAGIVVNKNSVPFDKKAPSVTSGIRLGTPALTTRGMKEREMKTIAEWITRILERPYDRKILNDVKSLIHSLCRQFPLY